LCLLYRLRQIPTAAPATYGTPAPSQGLKPAALPSASTQAAATSYHIPEPAPALYSRPQNNPGTVTDFPPKPSPHPTKWPPNLNAYVIRAFSTCKNNVDREKMTKHLEMLISKVTSQGSLSTYSWEAEKVPDFDPQPGPAKAPTTTENSAKRKNSRFAPAENESVTKKAKPVEPVTSSTNEDEALLQKRSDRFKTDSSKHQASQAHKKSSKLATKRQTQIAPSGEFDIESLRIKGTCESLEKDYFRLTSAPDPATVRPERVLRIAMLALKKKWRASAVDYIYMCSQLKAIRQDLTVQHVQSGRFFVACWCSVGGI
jgi:hypothetical protein